MINTNTTSHYRREICRIVCILVLLGQFHPATTSLLRLSPQQQITKIKQNPRFAAAAINPDIRASRRYISNQPSNSGVVLHLLKPGHGYRKFDRSSFSVYSRECVQDGRKSVVIRWPAEGTVAQCIYSCSAKASGKVCTPEAFTRELNKYIAIEYCAVTLCGARWTAVEVVRGGTTRRIGMYTAASERQLDWEAKLMEHSYAPSHPSPAPRTTPIEDPYANEPYPTSNSVKYTETAYPTASPTGLPASGNTQEQSTAPTVTFTGTATPIYVESTTATASSTNIPTPSVTVAPSVSASSTSSETPHPSMSSTPTSTATASTTMTASTIPSESSSPLPSASATSTTSTTSTPIPSASSSTTATSTPTPTPSVSEWAMSRTPVPSTSATASASTTPSGIMSTSSTPTSSASATPSPSSSSYDPFGFSPFPTFSYPTFTSISTYPPLPSFSSFVFPSFSAFPSFSSFPSFPSFPTQTAFPSSSPFLVPVFPTPVTPSPWPSLGPGLSDFKTPEQNALIIEEQLSIKIEGAARKERGEDFVESFNFEVEAEIEKADGAPKEPEFKCSTISECYLHAGVSSNATLGNDIIDLAIKRLCKIPGFGTVFNKDTIETPKDIRRRVRNIRNINIYFTPKYLRKLKSLY